MPRLSIHTNRMHMAVHVVKLLAMGEIMVRIQPLQHLDEILHLGYLILCLIAPLWDLSAQPHLCV